MAPDINVGVLIYINKSLYNTPELLWNILEAGL